jgi:glutaredoxin
MSRKLLAWIIISLCSFLGGGLPAASLAAPGQPITIYLFWTEGCSHCVHEKEFLASLHRDDPDIKIVALELSGNPDNRELFQKVGKALNADISGVPFTVIGTQSVLGWQDESTTGRAITMAIKEARRQEAPDIVATLRAGPVPPLHPGLGNQVTPDTLTVPLLGQINLKYLSLGLVTVIIGALDGFNPCALWVLIFLINLLLGMEDRKKMWALGGAFIMASSAVYFLFMTAWLNILVFLGFIFWIRIAIGLIALFAGGYNLREYLTDTAGVCKLSHGNRRQRTMDRLKEIIATRKFGLALGGIVLLALTGC